MMPTEVELAKVEDSHGEGGPTLSGELGVEMCLKLASRASKSTPYYLIRWFPRRSLMHSYIRTLV